MGGASGSPIFDTDGSVIAVNTASTSIPGTRLPSAALVNLGLRVDLIHGVGEKIPIREFLKLKRQFQNSSKLSKRPRFDLLKGAFSAVTLQVASANYPLQPFANGIFAIF